MTQIGEGFSIEDPEVAAALLRPAIVRAEEAMQRNLSQTLYGHCMPPKPVPMWKRKVRQIRRWAGESIADFASFVAGYDVRGDW